MSCRVPIFMMRRASSPVAILRPSCSTMSAQRSRSWLRAGAVYGESPIGEQLRVRAANGRRQCCHLFGRRRTGLRRLEPGLRGVAGRVDPDPLPATASAGPGAARRGSMRRAGLQGCAVTAAGRRRPGVQIVDVGARQLGHGEVPELGSGVTVIDSADLHDRRRPARPLRRQPAAAHPVGFGAILQSCSVSTRQIGSTPNRSRWAR